MRRLLAIALPTVAVLLLGSPAAAKEVTSAQVCGSDRCRSIDGASERLLMGGSPVGGPSVAEPFVRLEYTVGVNGHSQRVDNHFLPRSGLLLADDGMMWMRPQAVEALREKTRFVMPFPASRMASELPYALDGAGAAAPAAPAATAPPVDEEGSGVWWYVAPAAAAAIALALLLGRRRRGRGGQAPDGASGGDGEVAAHRVVIE